MYARVAAATARHHAKLRVDAGLIGGAPPGAPPRRPNGVPAGAHLGEGALLWCAPSAADPDQDADRWLAREMSQRVSARVATRHSPHAGGYAGVRAHARLSRSGSLVVDTPPRETPPRPLIEIREARRQSGRQSGSQTANTPSSGPIGAAHGQLSLEPAARPGASAAPGGGSDEERLALEEKELTPELDPTTRALHQARKYDIDELPPPASLPTASPPAERASMSAARLSRVRQERELRGSPSPACDRAERRLDFASTPPIAI